MVKEQAVVMLESLDHALERKHKSTVEIVGYGSTGDGYQLTAPTPDGSGAGKADANAMEEAVLTQRLLANIKCSWNK